MNRYQRVRLKAESDPQVRDITKGLFYTTLGLLLLLGGMVMLHMPTWVIVTIGIVTLVQGQLGMLAFMVVYGKARRRALEEDRDP